MDAGTVRSMGVTMPGHDKPQIEANNGDPDVLAKTAGEEQPL